MAASFRAVGGSPDIGTPRSVVSRLTTGTDGAPAEYMGSSNQGAGYDVLPDYGRGHAARRR